MCKILIAEDEILIAFQMSRQLSRRGFSVLGDIAATGEQAIGIAHSEFPQVILMDIGLAGKINGIETAIEIRKFLNAAIIFITGYTDQVMKDSALKLENTVFLEKPLDELQIIAAVKQFIRI